MGPQPPGLLYHRGSTRDGMTKTLLITSMYPPHHYGGYELSCQDVVERWRGRGHDVTVLTTDMRLPGVTAPADERARGVRRDLRFYFADGDLARPPLWKCVAVERPNQRPLRN